MKPTHVALFAAAGMFFSSFSVYSLTPSGGFRVATTVASAASDTPEAVETAAPASADPSHFATNGTLSVEGRIGLAKLAAEPGEEFMMVEVTGAADKKGQSAQVNLAIVIDRSGSMRGSRIRNAIRAANAAVDRLHEGDTVSVVTFDTQVQVIVPPTAVTSGSRDSINEAVRLIKLGGDTCISCGVEQAMTLIQQTSGKVNRMIVLSDGDANHGVRDLPGFRAMAQRARDKGVSITTIGVDVEYNEKVLSAISQESNGRHYFVENDEALAKVFEQEAEGLSSTVARDAELSVELPPEVELVRVFDRSFRRAGNKVIVPLGSFAAKDVTTVLMKVRFNGKRRVSGPAPIATTELAYRDLVNDKDVKVTSTLAATIVAEAKDASELDAVVASRVQRSETIQTLKEANTLFEQGKVVEAQKRVAVGKETLAKVAAKAKSAAPAKQRAVADDLARQERALGDANNGFAQSPPAPNGTFASAPSQPAQAAPASRAGKSAVRSNEVNAADLSR